MGKIAFLFSGQGAQITGMGKAWIGKNAAAEAVFGQLEKYSPGLMALCFTAEKAELSKTLVTQPCLFAVDLAAAEAVKAAGIKPDMVAGFSLGEIPALAFTGMLSREEAFSLVKERAKHMHACAEESPGSMAAIVGLSQTKIEDICRDIPDIYPVNYNCPLQTVIAGTAQALQQAQAEVKNAGGKSITLRVSGAFHTPFMQKAEEGLRNYLQNKPLFHPSIPLYANLTGEVYQEPYQELIAQQLSHPVHFEKTLHQMTAAGADTFIEVGIGKTLQGFVKKTLPNAKAYAVSAPEELAQVKEAILGGQSC